MPEQIDLETEVRATRMHATPHVRRIADIRNAPNTVLLSYLLNDRQIPPDEFTQLVSHPRALHEMLHAVRPRGVHRLPRNPYGIRAEVLPAELAQIMRAKTKRFVFGEGEKLLVADPQPRQYQYPSGFTAAYYLLTNEVCANISIWDMGYGIVGQPQPYVRKTSVDMMHALWNAVRTTPSYRSLAGMEDFVHNIPGIVIAHELCEMHTREDSSGYHKELALELDTERKTQDFLVHHGFKIRFYETYHSSRLLIRRLFPWRVAEV
jgi:hypothetical protein